MRTLLALALSLVLSAAAASTALGSDQLAHTATAHQEASTCTPRDRTLIAIRLDNRLGEGPVALQAALTRRNGKVVRRTVDVPAHTQSRTHFVVAEGKVATVRVDAGGQPLLEKPLRGRRCSTLMIGDSLTFGGRRALSEIHPTWTIDGLPGRTADRLIPVLGRHLRSRAVAPRTVVVALGTNERGASLRIYRRAAQMLPSRTRIVFVTTYRDPTLWGTDRARAMGKISRWMSRVAAELPHGCVVPWREEVMAHPEWLRDGTHQTRDDNGVGNWARLVSDHTSAC